MKDIQITESELEVMKVLWEESPLGSSQIIERLSKSTDWKPKTIQTLITRLVSKEAIITEKTNNKNFAYYPNIQEAEYKKAANASFLKKLYNGSINMMLSSFVKEQQLTLEDIEELKNLLEKEDKK